MTKEEIHDEQINPLMKQIINICKEHKIAFVGQFAFDPNPEDPDGRIVCTTSILADEYDPTESQLNAYDCLKPKPANFAAFTITTKPAGARA